MDCNKLVEVKKRLAIFEGAEAISREGFVICRVKVQNIRADESGFTADGTVIPTPGLMDDGRYEQFDIGAPWDSFTFDDEEWGLKYLGILRFQPELVAAVVKFAATLPRELSWRERFGPLMNCIQDCRIEIQRKRERAAAGCLPSVSQ